MRLSRRTRAGLICISLLSALAVVGVLAWVVEVGRTSDPATLEALARKILSSVAIVQGVVAAVSLVIMSDPEVRDGFLRAARAREAERRAVREGRPVDDPARPIEGEDDPGD